MKIFDIVEGKSENRELWDRIKSKGVVPDFNRERYIDRSDQGLEGPFRLKNGKVVYYDPQEGSYYDPDTDMYIEYDDYKKMAEEAELPNKKPAGYYVMRNGQSISYHQDKESAEKRARAANMRGGSNATVVRDDRSVKEGYYSVRSNQLKQELENNGWERIPAQEVPDYAKYGYRKNGVGRFYKVIDEPYHSFDVSFVKPRRVNALISLDDLLKLIKGSSVSDDQKTVQEADLDSYADALIKRNKQNLNKGHVVNAARIAGVDEKQLMAAVNKKVGRIKEEQLDELGGDQHYGDTKGAWDLNVGKGTPITTKKASKDALKLLNKGVSAQIAELIRKKNSVSSPIARKNIDSQIALLKRQRDKTNEEQGVAEGDKRPKYVVTTKDKPKIVKPSMGGESPHPYQGKLVGATEAEVSNTDYQWTHGKKPGGQGSWFFVAHRGGINFGKDVEGEDYVELHGMSYGDAKKAAVKWAKSKGHTSLFVAT